MQTATSIPAHATGIFSTLSASLPKTQRHKEFLLKALLKDLEAIEQARDTLTQKDPKYDRTFSVWDEYALGITFQILPNEPGSLVEFYRIWNDQSPARKDPMDHESRCHEAWEKIDSSMRPVSLCKAIGDELTYLSTQSPGLPHIKASRDFLRYTFRTIRSCSLIARAAVNNPDILMSYIDSDLTMFDCHRPDVAMHKFLQGSPYRATTRDFVSEGVGAAWLMEYELKRVAAPSVLLSRLDRGLFNWFKKVLNSPQAIDDISLQKIVEELPKLFIEAVLLAKRMNFPLSLDFLQSQRDHIVASLSRLGAYVPIELVSTPEYFSAAPGLEKSAAFELFRDLFPARYAKLKDVADALESK